MNRVTLVLTALFALGCAHLPSQQARPPLGAEEVTAIAELLKLEDSRRFDGPTLTRLVTSSHPEVRRRTAVTIGRVVNDAGLALLEPLKTDTDPEIVATAAFAMGQLKNPAAVAWLTTSMNQWKGNSAVAFESARALGKIRSPEARAALEAFLSIAPEHPMVQPVVGEALLSMGRFTEPGDLAPILKWTKASDVELRWRATWALFRPRNPAAVPHLLTLSKDGSPEVRFWAVRGLATASVDQLKSPAVTRDIAAASLREAVKDADRRVRTEALRVLMTYDDDASVTAVLAELDNPDTWMSVSAAETLGRHTTRVDQVRPRLEAAMAESKPAALRTVAKQQLTRLMAPPPEPAPAGGRAAGAGRAGGAGRGGAPAAPALPDRPLDDYRRLVEQWIVPAYNRAPNPRAVWMTSKGEIEIELFAADAPLGMEELVRLTESGAIVGPAFTRLVPNFVAQQATIPGANRLRDEVNRHGLLRANLAWASAGLDTGRPGYTLGNTPQPHNEGDFTSLGRVIRGMDVVDRLELGDAITAARIIKP
jgi:HEAT repeat protein/cyclophilin family peptidyl-prolyl cis-trans isomerase